MNKVLLINMPFRSIRHPAIGISLLKAKLFEEGISCDIRYLNIDFAKMIGLDAYEEIYLFHLLGERFFAQEYFPKQLPDEEEYKSFLKQNNQVPSDYIDGLLGVKKFIRSFMDLSMGSISWEQYDIIGFSTMFEQNLASAALAHRIKLLYPTKIIVFGGANCEGEMGTELHRCFPFIDYVCSGEADFSFTELVKRIRDKKAIEGVPGIVYREDDKSILTPGVMTVENLDAQPYPNYDDYFDQLEKSSFSPSICDELLMETSRGCWWGERSQCKFCGLNGGAINFRSKSKDRVVKELVYLTEKYAKKYSVKKISMVDNILDMKYFKELLPELKQRGLPVPLFYETKSNLKQEQVQMLRDAGVTFIQPGIESLNTHVLRLMGKGVSALQNIQLLKYCKQFNVDPTWSILTKFPGEEIEDYKQMIKLIYKITHLPPPFYYFIFSLQRFSPYFVSPEKYGIINVHPEDDYRFIYPFENSSISRLAYNFEFDYRDDIKPPNCDEELAEAVVYWQECYANNETLYSIETSPSALFIEDKRSNAMVSQTILESAQKDIYEYCDKIQNFSSIFSHIREKYSSYPVRARDIRDFLREMVDLNLMVNEDDNYLSLAIPSDEKTPIA